MENALVSAVITTHNRKDLLCRAVESVLHQTYAPMELIVVDDASTDGTDTLMTKLAAEKGFTFIHIPKAESKGGNHARNVGIQAAKGKFVALLDDDDEWMPEKIEKQMAYHREHPECRVIACLRIFEYNMKRRVPQDPSKRIEGDLKRKIFTKIACTTSELLIDKELLFDAGLFDEDLRYWQEYELSIRLFQHSPLGLVHEHLVLYRIIAKDKGRLTNNISGWQDAVKYIEKKHADLLSKLTEEEMKAHKYMIACDGASRANNIGDKKLRKYYLGEMAKYRPSLVNRIKYCFNINKLTFWK